MEQVKLSRIKAAGNNIRKIGYLILISNLIAVIAFIHISNLEPTELRQVSSYYMIYGFAYLFISISIMANLFFAGSNLSSCDVDTEEERELIQIVYRETTSNQTLKIVSVNYETIGAGVFIDDKIAEDGVYSYKNDGRKLIVKNGKIEKMITS